MELGQGEESFKVSFGGKRVSICIRWLQCAADFCEHLTSQINRKFVG